MIIKNYWRCLFLIGLNFLIISGNFTQVFSARQGEEEEAYTCARCLPHRNNFPRPIKEIRSEAMGIIGNPTYSPLDKGIGLWEIRNEILEDGARNERDQKKRVSLAQKITQYIVYYFNEYNPIAYPQHDIHGAYYEIGQFYKETGNTLGYFVYSWVASIFPETE